MRSDNDDSRVDVESDGRQPLAVRVCVLRTYSCLVAELDHDDANRSNAHAHTCLSYAIELNRIFIFYASIERVSCAQARQTVSQNERCVCARLDRCGSLKLLNL